VVQTIIFKIERRFDMSKEKSNKKQSSNGNSVWVVGFCRVPVIFGVFNTLEQAHDAICIACDPDDPLELRKISMPLHCHEKGCYTNRSFYLVWNEDDMEWYMEPPLFRITEHEIGQTYNIIEVKEDKSTESEDDDE
jgi:hypothetical protein